MPSHGRKSKKGKFRNGPVIYNLDCSEFFIGTFGPIVPGTIDRWVDDHARLGVTDLFINVNAQRTNYRSDAWESNWDGYDPDRGNEQPFFAGIDPQRMFETKWYINTYLLDKQGCDYPARMIKRARRDGVRPWISIRMNDTHYPEQPDHPYHSTFWRSHPRWRLSGGANPATMAAYGWASGGLDYGQPEVREHYLKLIKEVCARYDLDGIELDYLRFVLYFRPGREHQGAKLMNEFVRKVRTVTNKAAKRLGHPVKLAVRIPSSPWIARRHGLEAVAWAKNGLVDLVIPSPFWPSIDSDVPIETWKGLLIGTNVPVAMVLESGLDSGGEYRTATHEEYRGAMLSGWDRGADAVYFFNLFTGPYQKWPRRDHDRLVQDAGSSAALRARSRRHPVTIKTPWADGEPRKDKYLPYAGAHGMFRIHIGPKPAAKQRACVELITANDDQRPDVRVNRIPCPWSRLAESEHVTASGWTTAEARRQVYDVPAGALDDGYNLIEVTSKQPVTLTWVELSVL